MDDEFRVIFSEKCPYTRTLGAASLHALFAEDIKELGSNDHDWYLDDKVNEISSDEDNNSKNPEELSNHSNSTTDGISASVRNLLNLLVKRAASCQDDQRVVNDEDLNSSAENTGMLLADESWTSSMETPSKNNTSSLEIIDSDVNNLTYENSIHENSISTAENAENVDRVSTVEGEFENQELDCDFLGFDVPVNLIRKDNCSSERLDTSLGDDERFCSHYVQIMSKISQSSDVDTLMLLAFAAPSLKIVAPSENRNFVGESPPASDCVERQLPSCSHRDHIKESLHSEILCQTSKSLHSGVPSDTVFHSINNKSDRIDTTISDISQGINLSLASGEKAMFTGGANFSHVTNSHIDSATHDEIASVVLDEPKHVAEILNLFCSPAKKSEINTLQRKRNMSGDDPVQNKRSCFENESKLVVKELVTELLHEMDLQLFAVKDVFIDACVGPSDVNSSSEMASCEENVREPSRSCTVKLSDKEQIFDGIVDPLKECTNACVNNNLRSISDQDSNQDALNSYSSMQSVVSDHQSELVNESIYLRKIKSDAFCKATNSTNHTLSPEVSVATISDPCCESTTSKTFLPSSKSETKDAELQMEPEVENDSYLNCCGTEDFLSCSVLEEICQASEALAYAVKMKNDNVISDCHSQVEDAGDCCKRSEVDSTSLDEMDRFKCGREDDARGIKNYLSSDNSNGNCDNENNNCKLLSKTEITNVDQDEEQSVKKKILIFSAPSVNNEAIQLRASFGNKTDHYSEYQTVDSSPQSSRIPQDIEKTTHPHPGSDRNSSLQKSDNHNTFVYPKQVQKIPNSVPEGVCLKDVIISAVELERHSRFERNDLRPAPKHLKANSLVSFSNFENSLLGESILPESNDNNFGVQRPLTRDSTLLSEKVPESTSSIEYERITSEHHDTVTSHSKNMCNENKNMTFKVMADQPDTTPEKTFTHSKEEILKLNEANSWKCEHKIEGMESGIQIVDRNATERIDRSVSPIIPRRFRSRRKIKRIKGTKLGTAATASMKSNNRDTLKNIITRQCKFGENSTQNKGMENICIDSVNNKLSNKDRITKNNQEKHEEYLKNQHHQKIPTDDDMVTANECPLNQGNENVAPGHISTRDLGGPVGFTSASGKKVNVSMKSMLRAKSLFAEESTTIRGDSVRTADSVSKIGDLPGSSLDTGNENVAPGHISTRDLGGPVGFTSASGKKVNVSMKSMLRAKSLFAEESTPIRGGSVGTADSVSKIGELPGSSLDTGNENVAPGHISTRDLGGPVGFTSASGKKVNVSVKSMLRAKSLFAEESTPIRGGSVGTADSASKIRELPGSSLDTGNENAAPGHISTRDLGGPVGFTSASGKKVNVSMKSMLRAKSLFAEESTPIRGDSVGTADSVSKIGELPGSSLDTGNENVAPGHISTRDLGGPVGFTSASGKKVNISMKSLLRAKSLFAEESTPIRGDSVGTADSVSKIGELPGSSLDTGNENAAPGHISTRDLGGPVGFTSASGKKVNISMKSLLRAKSLFAEESTSIRGDSVGTADSVSKIGELPGSSLDTGNENVAPGHISTRDLGGPVGFTSASGKKVNVSMKSMLRAKSLFAEESTPIRGGSVGIADSVSKIGELRGSSLDTGNENAAPGHISTRDLGGPLGFTSASGKKVNVSMKSMLRAKSLFAEESTSIRGGSVGTADSVSKIGELPGSSLDTGNENVAPGHISTRDLGGPVGFTSASGKKVNVSVKSMLRAKSLFAEESTPIRGGSVGTADSVSKIRELPGSSLDTGNENAAPGHISTRDLGGPVGFTSASGKKVNVSMKSMLRAKSLFAEESNSIRGGSVGSADSVSKIGELPGSSLDTGNENVAPGHISTRDLGGPVGFTSASGKKVNVSVKSMLRAKSLFAEESTPIRGGSVGTADSVSKIGELRGSSLDTGNENAAPGHISTRDLGGPVGFTSASGKKVKVSMKSMLRAKSLFAEESNSIRGGSVGTADSVSKIGELPGSSLDTGNENVAPGHISMRDLGGPVGFASASGKKVNVSMKSMLRAKSLFAEESNSIRGGSVGTADSVSKIGELRGSSLDTGNENAAPGHISTRDLGGPVGFASASGKKVNVSMKSMLRAKSLFAEESTPIRVGSVGSLVCDSKAVESRGHVLNDCNTDIKDHSNFPLCSVSSNPKKFWPTPLISSSNAVDDQHYGRLFPPHICLSKNLEEEISASESMAAGRETFLSYESIDGSSLVRVNESTVAPSSCRGSTPSSDITSSLRKDNISDLSGARQRQRNETVVKCPKFSKNISDGFKSSSSLIQKNEGSNVRSPAVLNKPLIYENLDNVQSGRHVWHGPEQPYKSTQEVFQCESQGDDFIKAVDSAVLSSVYDSDTERPPSPVFRTSDRRRRRMKRTTSKSKLQKTKASGHSREPKLNAEVADTPVSASPSIHCDSSSSLMESLPLTDECKLQEKHSEPMHIDVGEESVLGTHVDLSEATGLVGRVSGDPWLEERKKQADIVASKKFIKPVFGSYLKIRTGKHLRRSLRDIVRGKKPGRYSKDQLRKFGVPEGTCSITSSNATDFKFKLQNYYVETLNGGVVCVGDGFRLIPDPKGMFGSEEAQTALLAGPGVDPSLLPPGGWCINHYRWIVWKLASLEKSFPQEFSGKCLTPENVMGQLKYRWDREIDSGERPALRRIFEKDDTASRRIILCISEIKQPNNPESCKQLELDVVANSSTLELTDGWYSITGIVDSEMDALIRKGKLSVGTKIVTSGGELTNSPLNGCHPLEQSASLVRLILHTNSTRRACWDAKLGFMCKHPGPLPVALNSVLPHGGAVNALKNVIVARTYPVVYVEKIPGDRKVVRSARAEARAASHYEYERQVWLESVYLEVSSEMQKEEEERRQKRSSQSTGMGAGISSRRSSTGGLRQWKRGMSSNQSEHLNVEELCSLCEEAGDPAEVLLTSTQLSLVSAYRQESRDKYNKELEDRVRQKLKEEEERIMSSNSKGSLNMDTKKMIGRVNRNVIPLLKVRLVDADQPVQSKAAILTIWQPSEEVMNLFSKEGTILNVYNLTAAGVRSNYLQLNSGKQTRYTVKETPQSAALLMENHPWLKRRILSRGFDDLIKPYSGPSSSLSVLPFGEIDLVATVIRIGKKPDKDKGFQHVYLAGSDGSLVSVAFWGGVQEFAVNEFLCPELVVVATNLQLRTYHGLHRLPTVQATEVSTFTLHPAEDRLKIALKNFLCEMEAEQQLKANDSDFIALCEQKLDTVSQEDGANNLNIELLGGPSKQLNPSSSRISSSESGYSMSPIVSAKIKKLQKFEGAPECSLPVHHLGKSAGVKKAFQPPQRSPD